MILLILALVLNACVHFRKIARNEFIQYGHENIESGFLIVGTVLIQMIFGLHWIDGIGLLIMAPSLRWFVHDLTLNYLRGVRWDYLGTRSNLDKFLRRVQNKTGLHFIFVKAALVGVSLLVWWGVTWWHIS